MAISGINNLGASITQPSSPVSGTQNNQIHKGHHHHHKVDNSQNTFESILQSMTNQTDSETNKPTLNSNATTNNNTNLSTN
jgi:hypothetical protein